MARPPINWLCTLCHRSGDEPTPVEAADRHRLLLLADAHNNEVMRRVQGEGWVGPSSECRGKIVMKWAVKKERRKKAASGVFVDEAGDTWVETGARMKVSGKVEER